MTTNSTTTQMVPQLKQIAEKIIDVVLKYPSTPYTESNVRALDTVMRLIDRCEDLVPRSNIEGETYGYNESHRAVQEGHSEGQEALQP